MEKMNVEYKWGKKMCSLGGGKCRVVFYDFPGDLRLYKRLVEEHLNGLISEEDVVEKMRNAEKRHMTWVDCNAH